MFSLLIDYLDTKDAVSFCMSNKEYYSLLNQDFWQKRTKLDFDKNGVKEDYIALSQQKMVLEMVKQKRNVFMTGPAGSGKSYMIRQIKELYPTIPLTSSTGVSAFLIKGSTFHSFFGVGTGSLDKDKLFFKVIKRDEARRRIQQTRCLIIDEVSMLSPILFEKVDYICRKIRKSESPFGGIQLILVGDFFQLPPVKETTFLFETETWKNLDLFCIHFKKIYRQEDPAYISLLTRIRMGQVNKQDIESLKSRMRDSEDENLPYIFSKKIEVQNLNTEKMNQIQEPTVEFKSKVGYQFFKKETPELKTKMLEKVQDIVKDLPFDDILKIKKGSRVMLKVNLDVDLGLVNGSIGTIQEIKPLVVKFDNGIEIPISYYNLIHEEEDFAISISVIPLIVAWAFTIHSVQGCTLEKAKIDISTCFDFGQVYVALSRVKNWEGLYLMGFNPYKIKSSPKVIDFYNKL